MPTALVLGGLGHDGARQLVTHLYRSEPEYSLIRVVDKYLILPKEDAYTTYIDSELKEVLKDDSRVQYKQANLFSDESRAKAFALPDGKPFDVVFSFLGETEPDLPSVVYTERTIRVGLAVGQAAARSKVPVFFQTLQPYYRPSEKKGVVGRDASEPWGDSARWLHELGRLLGGVAGLNPILFRHGILYGPSTVTGVTRLCLLGDVYAHKKEEFDFLWSPDLEKNTLNIQDLSQGLVKAARWALATPDASLRLKALGERLPPSLSKKEKESLPSDIPLSSQPLSLPVLTFVDTSSTTQGKIANVLESVIGSGLKTHFLGATTSLFAKLSLKDVVKEANETHLEGWSDLLREYHLDQSYPITPFFGSDVLSSHPIKLSAEKTSAAIGWTPTKQLTPESVDEGLASFRAEKLWPGRD